MLEKEVYNQIFEKSFSRKTIVKFWDGTVKVYGEKTGKAVFHIHIKKKIPLSSLKKNASLVFGEAYMAKNIEIEGNIQDLIYDIYTQTESFLNNSQFRRWLPKEVHSKQQSKSDIHSHYDLGNDFYELWLDPSLTYSCAYFEKTNDSLEVAQINKIKHILDKLSIKDGDTLLDIGCGWGTLLFVAAKKYNIKVAGITLSQEQFDFVKKKIMIEGLENRISVELMDYRNLESKYDHITSVGMFEHVGSENLQEFFRIISNCLKPKGTALIHGICCQAHGARNAWINKYIFPGGYIPSVSELINDITGSSLQLIDFESLRRDYQYTLQNWTENFHQIKGLILNRNGENFYRMWDLYLQSCAASFQSSNIDVIQYLLVHPNNNAIPFHRSR